MQGCLELLHRSGVSLKGKKAVVVGRSNIVGLPVSMLLLKADATVTIVHSHTSEPERIIREADIVIAAAGQPMMVMSETYFTTSASPLLKNHYLSTMVLTIASTWSSLDVAVLYTKMMHRSRCTETVKC